MKKILFFLYILYSSTYLFAQPHLRISNISGLPVFPVDTAYEAGTYTVSVTVVNDDIAIFQDNIFIAIQADSLANDSIILDTIVSIPPGDSIIMTRQGYTFSPNNFNEGDNIVVVWPVAATVIIPYEPFQVDIYFVSLIASVPQNLNDSFIVYPNPATKNISLIGMEGIRIKQVRIYDVFSRLIYQKIFLQKLISIEDWPPGLYIIQLENEDGFIRNIKLQKN